MLFVVIGNFLIGLTVAIGVAWFKARVGVRSTGALTAFAVVLVLGLMIALLVVSGGLEGPGYVAVAIVLVVPAIAGAFAGRFAGNRMFGH